ncbi:MoaD/ThiS family protein [Niabella beijingensis]|uniref:MoaD/ThiS family protein n=1 Tax=Niabella beijingensis TaxID=2872700 RepID=UPI001CBBFB2D|nr:MoaD/ThiS family protein [Niabella beijingensis]MBZ4191343.1 MoaD/ThiS family protein [Niabella beijingensis]
MAIQLLFFGPLSEIAGATDRMDFVPDTDTLKEKLYIVYPALKKFKYVIAVNKKIIRDNATLQDGSIVALLPPYSGG